MGCIGYLLPFLGLLGFYNEIWWLFYIAGGLCLIMDVISLFNGQLRCWGSIVTIVFWIIGYRVVGSFWNGLIWGTCVSTLVLTLFALAMSVFTFGIGGVMVGFDWIKKLFGRTDDE